MDDKLYCRMQTKCANEGNSITLMFRNLNDPETQM